MSAKTFLAIAAIGLAASSSDAQSGHKASYGSAHGKQQAIEQPPHRQAPAAAAVGRPAYVAPQRPMATGPIRWIDDPDQAVVVARQTGLPIIAYVTSAHCGYCRKMEHETWSQPTVTQRVAQGFVPLRLNSERHTDIVAALRVRAFPTTVLLTPEGRGYAGTTGFLSAKKLIELLKVTPNAQALASQPVPR